jgi:translation initiation factor IF-2
MSTTTVAEFAAELKKSPDTLLEQLRGAGVAKAAVSDVLSESDKQRLLGYLQASHGTATLERKKITLVKKSTSEIKQADSTGRARTIQVEVRKKRTFIKRDEGMDASPEGAVLEAELEVPSSNAAEEAELARREEEARRQAELMRRQEEELIEKRRQREEQEARERAVAEKAEAEAEAAAKAAARAQAEQQKAAAPTPPLSAVGQNINAAAEAAAQAKAQADAAAAQVKAQAEADARAKVAAEAKARADEEAARVVDLGDRRRKAEAEAAAIRLMMSTPKKVLVARNRKSPSLWPSLQPLTRPRPA